MALSDLSRRDFVATTVNLSVAFIVANAAVRTSARPCVPPSGAVAGRVDAAGIAAGRASSPSWGRVILVDGRIVDVTHESHSALLAGATVLLVPGDAGRWSVLYAEV